MRTEVIYRNGVIEIDAKDDKFIFYQRNLHDVERFGDVITRHGKNILIGEEPFELKDTVENVVANMMHGGKPTVSMSIAERSLRMIWVRLRVIKKIRKLI